MELQQLILFFIVAAAVLFIFNTAYLEGASRGKPPELPKAVIVVSEPEASNIEFGRIDRAVGKCEWNDIKVPVRVKYSAKFKPGEAVEAVPIVLFKGQEKVAKAGGADSFTLTEEDPETETTIEVDKITTDEPPVRLGGASNEGREGSVFLIEAAGKTLNFRLKIEDISLGKFSKASEFIENRNKCGTTVEVACANRAQRFDLFDADKECQGGLLEKCQKVFDMCGNTVILTGREMDCKADRAKIDFSIDGDVKPFNVLFPVGEEISVSFFRKQCAEKFEQAGSASGLWRFCGEGDYLGTRTFTAGIATTLCT